MIYVQYNPETGLIGSTVQHNTDGDSTPDAPVCDNQIIVSNDTILTGMMVDPSSQTLIPIKEI